jgi:hypothetical protein
MRLSDLTIRQGGIGVPVLGLLNWAVLQFAVLPNMSADQRRQLYPNWISSPYLYATCVAFVCVALWFVFRYRGTLATQERRIALFAMALGSLCGTLLILALRVTWRI